MNEKVKGILDRLLAAFDSGEVPVALAISTLPRVEAPSSRWSLCNRLLVFFSGSSDARGFQQWKKVGRYPKKGSKAIYILAPKIYQKSKEDSEDTETVLTGFIPVPVFRVEDTAGKSLEMPDLQPREMPPLYEVAQKWGITVSYCGFQGDAYGYFAPGRREIVLATHDEQTFFHELAHVAHGKVKGRLKGGQDWRQEIVAELTAAVLAHLYGKRLNDGASYRYIKSYAEKAGKDVYRACLGVVCDVERCLGEILTITRENSGMRTF